MAGEIALGNVTPSFSTQPTLDGVTYTLAFKWNVRDQAWYMDVLDAQGITTYVGSIKLVADFPLAYNFSGRLPTGWFIARDTSGKGIDPGLADLGSRVVMAYVSQADTVAAIAQG